MKTFDEYRLIEQVDLVDLDDDEWVVKHEGVLEDDIIVSNWPSVKDA